MINAQKKNIFSAANNIKSAESILILTGAGMGVDSGLPDFRGKNGFWREYPIFEHLKLNFEDIANPKWFDDDPTLAWGFYGHRLNQYREVIPHAGFSILKQLITKKKGFVYTTNVDGQFQKAGFDRSSIVELHGSIHHLQCKSLCTHSVIKNRYNPVIDTNKMRVTNDIVKCEYCDSIMRPNILMFGDCTWSPIRYVEQEYRYREWLNRIDVNKLCVIEIGVGTALPILRWITDRFAAKGSKCIRIDPQDEYIFDGIGLRMTALNALTEISCYL